VSFLDPQLTAFTATTSSYVQPTIGQPVVINVQSSNWIPLGLSLYVAGGGFYTIDRILDVNRVRVVNVGGSGCVSAGTTVPGNARVIAVGQADGGGGGGSDSNFVVVADNAARDAIPIEQRHEGMQVYSLSTKVYYSLGTNLTTWRAIDANPVLATQSDWYVAATGGSDDNDGTSGHPLASLDELRARLNPGGAWFRPQQSTTVHVGAGTYNALELSISIPVGSNYAFTVACDYVSGSSITLSGVTNTVGSTTPTRGSIQTASGAFADKARIRSTSGANVGAITYCTGLTSSTNAFVKTWMLDSGTTVNQVNIANGTTCCIDTLQVTITRVQIRVPGNPLAGSIVIKDAILPRGAEVVNTIGGSAALYFSQCLVGNTLGDQCRFSGNLQLRNCRLIGAVGGANFTFFGTLQPVLWGCSIETQITAITSLQLAGSNCFNGGTVKAGGITQTNIAGAVYLSATEWVNGGNSDTAVSVGSSSNVEIAGQQFGFGSSYAVGFALIAGAFAIADSAAYLGILATQQVTLAGQNHTYADLPKSYGLSDCTFAVAGTAGAPYASARFGATFYVDPAHTGFSNGTQANPYPSITTAIAAAPSTGALIFLAPFSITTENVTFPTTGVWEVRSEAEVGTTIQGNVVCTGGAGAAITLTTLIVTGTVTGDFTSATGGRSLILNNTDINGAVSLTSTAGNRWTLILNGLGGSLAGLNGALKSTASVVGAIQASNYYFVGAVSFSAASQLNNCHLTSGSIGVGANVLIENTVFDAAVTFTGAGVVTMDGFSHASAVAAGSITLAGGATLTIRNSVALAGIQQGGATTGQTLAWGGSAWAPSSNVVTSVFGRTGAIVAVNGDYGSNKITNFSSAPGSTVDDALTYLRFGPAYPLSRSGSGSTTIVVNDRRRLIRLTAAATVTVPTNATQAFTAGDEIVLSAESTGAITFAPAGGVTIHQPSTFSNTVQWALYHLVYLGSDEWLLTQEANRPVIVNADVDAAAAIAGTKIAPDFGSQNIVTTGYCQAPQIGDGTSVVLVHATSFRSDCAGNFFGLGAGATTVSNGSSASTGSLPQLTVSACDGTGSGTYKGGNLLVRGGSGNTGTGTGGDLYLGGGDGSAANGNVSMHLFNTAWQGMQRGIYIANCSAVPTGNPSTGGFLYVESGALKYRGSSGTVTTIAPA